MVVFSTSEAEIRIATRLAIPASDAPRPLLIGSSVVLTEDRQLVVIGGAATCFSMGTFCMLGTRVLSFPSPLSLLRTDLAAKIPALFTSYPKLC